jgi:hypothetical protein
MGDLWFTAISLVFILICVGIGYAQYKSDTKFIRLYLGSRGATDIIISKVWFAGGNIYNVYDVTYTDIEQQRRQNRCIIQSGFSLDRPIYWKDDISR